jgi:hypothetical protein
MTREQKRALRKISQILGHGHPLRDLYLTIAIASLARIFLLAAAAYAFSMMIDPANAVIIVPISISLACYFLTCPHPNPGLSAAGSAVVTIAGMLLAFWLSSYAWPAVAGLLLCGYAACMLFYAFSPAVQRTQNTPLPRPVD